MTRGLDFEHRESLWSFEGARNGALRCEGLRDNESFPAAIAAGRHLFPFRTEKLSPPAPMVLGGRPPGRVGRRRDSDRQGRSKRPFFFLGGRRRPSRTRLQLLADSPFRIASVAVVAYAAGSFSHQSRSRARGRWTRAALGDCVEKRPQSAARQGFDPVERDSRRTSRESRTPPRTDFLGGSSDRRARPLVALREHGRVEKRRRSAAPEGVDRVERSRRGISGRGRRRRESYRPGRSKRPFFLRRLIAPPARPAATRPAASRASPGRGRAAAGRARRLAGASRRVRRFPRSRRGRPCRAEPSPGWRGRKRAPASARAE